MEFKKYGILPAIVSLFDENGNVDIDAMKKLTKDLVGKGVDGFYAGGATGEGFLMGVEDRKKVIKAVCDATEHRVPVIAYIGSNDTKTALDLANFAEQCGADAISSVPPYMGAFTFDMIYGYYKDLAESVKIPLIIYSNTFTRALSFDEVVKLCSIKNIIGVKYTSTNHYTLRMLTKTLPEKIFFSGADEMFVSGVFSGCAGAMGTTYNFAPELFVQLRDAYENKDLDKVFYLNEVATSLVDIFIRHSFLRTMKVALSKLGFGKGYCRKPYSLASEDEMKSLIEELIDFRTKNNVYNVDFLNKLCEIFELGRKKIV